MIKLKIRKGSKLYYIKKEGRSATGCFFRDGTSSISMSEAEIERRLIASLHEDKLSLADIQSYGNDYTFDILKIKLRSTILRLMKRRLNVVLDYLQKKGNIIFWLNF